jgi:hypothetical protein
MRRMHCLRQVPVSSCLIVVRQKMFAAASALAFSLLLGACSPLNPYINSITPAAVPACSQIDFSGLFVNVTQAFVVDGNGVKTQLSNLEADPIFGQQIFRLKATLPPVPVGPYNVSIDENGGSIFVFLGFVNPGTATSTTRFNITTAVQAPQLTLLATDSPAPGDAATLTPTVVGTATSAVITPGGLSATEPHTVHPCKTTTYTLSGGDQCAIATPAQVKVTVANPVVTEVSPVSVAAGDDFVISGTGFNAAVCGVTQIELVSGGTKYTQVTLAGDETSLSSVVNPCVPPGLYDVVVHTAVGDSNASVSIRVTPPTITACPGGGNDCTKDACQGGVCTHEALTGPVCSEDGQSGKCSSGTCEVSGSTTTPPVCVQVTSMPTDSNLNECVPNNLSGPHCCSTPAVPALCNYTICRACISHGGACGVSSTPSICCSPDDLCVADPVTAVTTCNVPDSPPSGD